MQAKIYAPTIAQRQEGLRLEERFWTRGLFVRLALYSSIPVIMAWYDAGFRVPVSIDGQDLIVGALAAAVGEIVTFFNKKERAKWHAEDHEEAAKQLGPMQYRLTDAGVDIWACGEREHYLWKSFERFKLTDELLVVSRTGPGGGYWVFPREEAGEELLSVVLQALEEGGVIRGRSVMAGSVARTLWPVLPIALLGAALGCSRAVEGDEPVQAPRSACEPVMFEDTPLTHCLADPAEHRIRTALDAPDGDPARSLAVLADIVPEPGKVAFAMNGGMFDAEGNPIGYYVEDGERRHTLNRNEGGGNFHLMPNGVFYGTGGEWHVRTSEDFAANVTTRPEFATQSGPMLVIGGKLHPAFDADGESKKTRNAVGVDEAGRAHFVISEAPVSFGKLARYFRDRLETPNALFLDGSVSQLWDPARERMDGGAELGPLIVVENRAKAAP